MIVDEHDVENDGDDDDGNGGGGEKLINRTKRAVVFT